MKSLALLLLLSLVFDAYAAKKGPKASVEDIVEHKDFKKLLRTKNNVLVYFFDKPSKNLITVVREVADKVKGTGTLVSVDCNNSDGNKLCKKLKVKVSSKGYVLKHFKDGEFHKDYDRLETVESLTTFLRDPKGDAPWEEDQGSADVVHINDPKHFAKLMKNE